MLRESEEKTGSSVTTVMDELAAGREAEPYDFRDVVDQPDSVNDPEFLIQKKSPYVAKANALGTDLLMKAAKLGSVGDRKADYVILSRLKENESVVVLTPTLKATTSTAPVSWVDDGTRAKISLRQLFMIRRFPIPRGNVAHIPATPENVENLGPSVLLHMDDARFEPVRPASARRVRTQANRQPSNATGSSTAGSSQPAGSGSEPKQE